MAASAKIQVGTISFPTDFDSQCYMYRGCTSLGQSLRMALVDAILGEYNSIARNEALEWLESCVDIEDLRRGIQS